jgi:hypothetical protein
MNGVMKDMRRRPDKVKAACEALVAPMINIALGTGDPLKRWPIFVPTHKPMFLSPKEYDEFIADPTTTMIKKVCPRLHSEEDGPYTVRMANAFVKAGMAQAAFGAHMRRRTDALANECGMPQPMGGGFAAPLDALSDTLRDMRGVMKDMRRHPDKVKAACEALVAPMINIALGTGDPFKRWPIFVPTHKPMFLSPKEYDEFYWPSFKKVLQAIVDSGHKVRCYLEGNQDAHVHHFKELPKGTILLDIDGQSDIFKVKEIIGDHQCIAGGLNDSMLIIGSPEKMKERVKHLCETLGKRPGFILSGSCNIPFDTKPEIFQALCEAVEEYGWLDRSLELKVKPAPQGPRPAPLQITPWEVKKAETGVQGNEALVKSTWDALENQAHTFWWQWAF